MDDLLCVAPAETKINKSLLGLPRRNVRLPATFLEQEFLAQLRTNGLFIVTHHLKTAALRGTIQRECRDDRRAVRSQCPAQCGNITASFFGRCQKMKNRAVVPKAKTPRRLEGCYVRLEPLDQIRPRTEARAAVAERRAGPVQHRQARVTSIKQKINQRRGSATDIKDACVPVQTRGFNQCQRCVGTALIPTYILRVFGLVNPIPMFLPVQYVVIRFLIFIGGHSYFSSFLSL